MCRVIEAVIMQETLIPSREQIFKWIEEIHGWGVRRPGYPASEQAEQFSLESFQRAGLEKVRKESLRLPYWHPAACSLHIITAKERFNIDCFPLPHSSPVDRLELELVNFNSEDAMVAEGKAVLQQVPLLEIPPLTLIEAGQQLEQLQDSIGMALGTGGVAYDPSGTLASQTQIMPFSGLIQQVMEPAIGAGAGAFIGVLDGYPGDSFEYYVPYDGIERPIPGVWIRGSDGARIKAAMQSGQVRIELSIDSERKLIEVHNIVGELPGADDEEVIIGSHHDGPWSSAVEDASGMALVFAQARYWAGIPRVERPHKLTFLLNAGHMAGGAGCEAYIDRHRSELQDIVLEIHLEHAAAEFRDHGEGLKPTGLPEPRWFFTSRNPWLQKVVFEILQAEGLDRSLILPPDILGDRPTTDGGAFHLAGIPLVNYLTAPFYLFDPMDNLDKIHKPSLDAITRATIRLVEATGQVSARQMRDGISG
jgi:hypothetical protein